MAGAETPSKVGLSSEAVGWLTSGEHGISSEALFNRTMFVTTGSRWHTNHPHDPDDFRRCHMLVLAVPEVRQRLSAMADESSAWARLVEHWDAVAASLESEIPDAFSPNAQGNAPQTYRLMRSLIDAV